MVNLLLFVVMIVKLRFIGIFNYVFFNGNSGSSQQHQEADFKGIHEKICSLLIPLRSLAPIVSSEDDRLRRNLTIKVKLSGCCVVELLDVATCFVGSLQE